MNYILGYANAKIYKCDVEKCPRPGCYTSGGSSKDDSFPCARPGCPGRMQLIRHVSFVDCPGHDILMATMLNGAAVMDAAFLLIGNLFNYLLTFTTGIKSDNTFIVHSFPYSFIEK